MLLGGLWHGASWTFVLWGGLHGAYLVVNHLWRRTGLRMPPAIAWALTFGAVMVGWVFFRAPSLQRAQVILPGMAGLNGFEWSDFAVLDRRQPLSSCSSRRWPSRGGARTGRRSVEWRWKSDYVYAAAFALLAGVSILRFGDPSPFLYFLF